MADVACENKVMKRHDYLSVHTVPFRIENGHCGRSVLALRPANPPGMLEVLESSLLFPQCLGNVRSCVCAAPGRDGRTEREGSINMIFMQRILFSFHPVLGSIQVTLPGEVWFGFDFCLNVFKMSVAEEHNAADI